MAKTTAQLVEEKRLAAVRKRQERMRCGGGGKP